MCVIWLFVIEGRRGDEKLKGFCLKGRWREGGGGGRDGRLRVERGSVCATWEETK